MWTAARALWLPPRRRRVWRVCSRKRRETFCSIQHCMTVDDASTSVAFDGDVTCSRGMQVRYGRARLLPWLSRVGCDCASAEDMARKGGGQPDESVVQHGGWQGRVAPWQDRKKRREQAQAQMREEDM